MPSRHNAPANIPWTKPGQERELAGAIGAAGRNQRPSGLGMIGLEHDRGRFEGRAIVANRSRDDDGGRMPTAAARQWQHARQD